MTKISLITQGQQLICANKVVIAAGDINSVELKVEFDSAWDDYPAKSATFYTSSNPTVQEMLLLNNSCVVPFEVLTESCVLFIGVRGVSADGERLKTSTLAKYKISEGATAGDKTLSPTMDLYQQYLAALKTEADPIIESLRQDMQVAIQEIVEAAKQSFSQIEGVVLWDSAAEGAEIVPENGTITVSFDATKYKTFRVLAGTHESTVTEKGKGTRIYEDNVGGTILTVTIADDGATIKTTHAKEAICSSVKIIGYTY